MRERATSVLGAAALLLVVACGVTGPEVRELVLFVAPQPVECRGEGVHQCLLVKESADEEWRRFSDPIVGFDHEPGFLYQLLVRREPISDPPADGSSVRWTLLRVLEKIRSGTNR